MNEERVPTPTQVVVTAVEPYLHACAEQGNTTLCGLENHCDNTWYRSKQAYLDIFEAEPHHRVYAHRCGICWYRYSHADRRDEK